MSLIRSYEIPYETATKKSKLDEIQKYSFKISPLSLGPDKASNIFGEYKDQTSMIDDILYNISKVSNVTIYHVIHHKTTLVRKIIGSKIQVIKSSKTKKMILFTLNLAKGITAHINIKTIHYFFLKVCLKKKVM